MNAQYEAWGMRILNKIEQFEKHVDDAISGYDKGKLTLIESEIIMDKLLELQVEVNDFNRRIAWK